MIEGIEGIDSVVFNVLRDGKELLIQEDGYLGRLEPGKITVRIEAEPPYIVDGFVVDGSKNVIPKKNLAADPEAGKIYQFKVEVKQNDDGVCFTRFPANHMRLAKPYARSTLGWFDVDYFVRIWEIAVISQAGEFFLTVQQTYEAEAFRDSRGAKVYPQFDGWPQMNDWLVSLCPDNFFLPPINDYQPDEVEPLDRLAENEAVVDWFNFAQGLGCLKLSDGRAARVHWCQLIDRRPVRAFLLPGEHVHFDRLAAPVQTQVRSTRFEWEANGVSLIF
ncbi:MAG: hypothetical protein U1C49_02870 [Candidatus Andersenbacteria bacterium]|nr:hypothetical protein [bacterium]MDZ4225769.1 hypothetical protein [Candidatus Andersenbacteria bacterium]